MRILSAHEQAEENARTGNAFGTVRRAPPMPVNPGNVQFATHPKDGLSMAISGAGVAYSEDKKQHFYKSIVKLQKENKLPLSGSIHIPRLEKLCPQRKKPVLTTGRKAVSKSRKPRKRKQKKTEN